MIEGATEAMTRTEERREDVRRVTDVFTTRSRALATEAAADMLPCAIDCREFEIADWFIRLQRALLWVPSGRPFSDENSEVVVGLQSYFT